MELRAFAERVLFGTSLEDKLAGPGEPVTDMCPGSGISVPSAPGRPGELAFAGKGERVALPRGPALEEERDRAVLLHGFANHELLATELMALVLLRFPEAPAEFRLGLYGTLREEQGHTAMYLRRLRECGVAFGQFPVNRYFWDAVAGVESPVDYVARLSLTFEQANLDYARHYAEVFARSGDGVSASILRKVYRDEIAHVNYGLTWFRRWRDEGLSDWEAFSRRLVFPLSPSRAKANGDAGFNRAGRLEAGLDADFVRRLELFERSKGRTPRVFWFCPGAESSIATGSPREDEVARRVGESLELLLAFCARRDDVLLVRNLPPLEHLEVLRNAGFVLPELEETDAGGELAGDSLLRSRKIQDLSPWAWCPQSVHLLAPLEPGLPDGAAGPGERWNEAVRILHSKGTHQEWLREFLGRGPVPGTDPGVVGREVRSLEELAGAVARFRREGFGEILLKAWFGTAGRGHRRWDGGTASLTWARHRIEEQGGVVVEPWLDRVLDFSLAYEMGDQGLRLLGPCLLENTPRGQFRAVSAGPGLTRHLDAGVARFFHATVLPFHDGEFRAFLEDRFREAGYRGPVGVDAFVFRTASGDLAWKPVAEVNPRHTMGRVVHEILGQVAPGRKVRLEVGPESPTDGGEESGWRLDPGTGRLGGGTVRLTPRIGERGFRALLQVGIRAGKGGETNGERMNI